MTLSVDDVSKTEPQWTCRELNVVELLELSDRFTYYLTRVLYGLADL